MIAASPTLNICSNIIKDSVDMSSRRPCKKKGSAAIQFHDFPASRMECTGRPIAPCQEKPSATYTRALTPTTHSDASITCAALRQRPSPEFTSAKPAPAKGTRRIRTKQIITSLGEKEEVGKVQALSDSETRCQRMAKISPNTCT